MESGHIRQRSASHGSLQSNFRSQNRARSQTNPRPRSNRRPLRSVNENAHLLRSPGPLESMLKTTTETGDIGFFTIKPLSSRASDTTSSPQLLNPLEDNLPQTPRRGDTRYYSDDRKQLPSSYRDTTSEIISLYGSDIYPSCSRSFSPAVDESRRSYSLTTCGSRRIQSQKSSATLQSQSSSVALQRPRSPFPYPTRLKRPGVRPASPALTENGAIDYSKMVELDRVSHRTIHSSYRPVYPPGLRRQPPLSLRADANRSTMSLPTRSSPAPHPTWPGPNRAWTPCLHPATPANIDRDRRGSNAQSIRSASLTSIVEMYNRPTKPESSRFYGSFYYDYTEEFEEDIPPVEPAPPLCPIPQRIKGLRPPVILKDECEEQMGEEETETPVSDMEVENQPLQGDIIGVPNGLDPSPIFTGAIKSLEENCPTALDQCRTAEADFAPSCQDIPIKGGSDDEVSPQDTEISETEKLRSPEPLTPNITPETKVTILSTSDANQPLGTQLGNASRVHWRRSKTLPSMSELRKLKEQKRPTDPNVRNPDHVLEPGSSEFATLLTSLDRLGKASLPNIEDNTQHSRSLALTEVKSNSGARLEQNNKSVISDTVPSNPSEKLKEEKEFQKRHRRNLAALRISTTGLGVSVLKTHNIPPSSEEIPILSPEPISPARELRVKNSIPQLMKALPALPGEPSPNLAKSQEHIFSVASNDCLVGSPVSALKSNGALVASQDCHTSPQKFKLKIKKSISQEASSQEGQMAAVSADPGLPAPASPSPGKKKLKIKLSRSQLGKGLADCGGTIIRSPALKQCNSLADLEYCSRRDMFTDPSYPMNKSLPQMGAVTKPALPNQADDNQELGSPLWYSGQIGMNCLEIAKMLELKTPPPISSVKEIRFGDNQSISSHETKPRSRGLRHKISLHLRLGGTQSKKYRRAPTPLPFSVQETSSCALGVAIDHQMLNPPNDIVSKRSGRVGIRVRKWARGAKRVVRSCVKKKLDRKLAADTRPSIV